MHGRFTRTPSCKFCFWFAVLLFFGRHLEPSKRARKYKSSKEISHIQKECSAHQGTVQQQCKQIRQQENRLKSILDNTSSHFISCCARVVQQTTTTTIITRKNRLTRAWMEFNAAIIQLFYYRLLRHTHTRALNPDLPIIYWFSHSNLNQIVKWCRCKQTCEI